MNTNDCEQMQLDTRSDLSRAISEFTTATIASIQTMIQQCGEAPTAVRNRHEAYGVVAEHYARIAAKVKEVGKGCGGLLEILPYKNVDAVETVSSIFNSLTKLSTDTLFAAAEVKRTLNDLYIAENLAAEKTPMEELVDDTEEFQDAEPTDTDEE